MDWSRRRFDKYEQWEVKLKIYIFLTRIKKLFQKLFWSFEWVHKI